MENYILKTIKPVVAESKLVKINTENIKKICDNFEFKNTDSWMDGGPFNLSKLSDEQKLNFIFVFGSLNFCYWGEPKWTIKYQNNFYDGAWGMMAALGKAIENKKPIIDAKFLATLTPNQLKEIFFGNTKIPLFDDRLSILQENGLILLQKFNGKFSEVIKEANHDAEKLVKIIVKNFPTFNDYAFFKDQKVLFYKRAQLTVSDVCNTYSGKGIGYFSNIQQLTACAEYKLPQVLRKMGILEYQPQLASKIDSKIEIAQGSAEEVEIRANMVWAAELMKHELIKKYPNITASQIDGWLWLKGQIKSPNDKPYHRTRTIFY